MMAENEFYVWCPYCGKVTPAKLHWWGTHLLCVTCGNDLGKEAKHSLCSCPECGSEIYRPEKMIGKLYCHCGAILDGSESAGEPEDEKPEDEAPANEAPAVEAPVAREPEPKLRCDCGAEIKCENGIYRCPLCGIVYSEEEIGRRRYLAEHCESINISCDNANMDGRLIYVHPHGKTIGYGSAVIVDGYQRALYRAGGKYYDLDSGETYALFKDGRPEKVRRESLDFGKYVGMPPIQLDTKVIFFDVRGIGKKYEAERGMAIGSTGYSYWPKLDYKLSIHEPKVLLSNAFDFEKSDAAQSVQETFVDWAEGAISHVVSERIEDEMDDDFALDSANEVLELRRYLRRLLPLRGVEAEINGKLDRDERGIRIHIVSIGFEDRILENVRNPVKCPHCGREIEKQKGDYACPLCKRNLWICQTCGTPNKSNESVCVKCGLRTGF